VTAFGGVSAVSGDGPTYLYAIGDQATFAYGCFGNPGQVPQCMCPILLSPQFTGTFGLTPAPGGDPLFDTFVVSDIDWTASLPGEVEVTGSGIYEIGTGGDGNPVHRMTLDLFFDGAGPVVFDSGLVEGGDDSFPPVITIPVSDGFGCPGRRITVAASAAGGSPADVAPPGGDGVVNITDFFAVIADWGRTGPRPTDIDGSGEVDILDFMIVLAEWSE
jgi:hypothetical protein